MSRQGKNPTDPWYSETTEPENLLNSKETIKNAKMKRQLHGYKAYASTYNVEILNTFNPELQLKDTELITAFQIIEDDDKSRTWFSNLKAETIINESDINDTFVSIYNTIFFPKPLFTQKEKLNLKTCNSTLQDIYRISVGEKLKNNKRKENIIILKYTHK